MKLVLSLLIILNTYAFATDCNNSGGSILSESISEKLIDGKVERKKVKKELPPLISEHTGTHLNLYIKSPFKLLTAEVVLEEDDKIIDKQTLYFDGEYYYTKEYSLSSVISKHYINNGILIRLTNAEGKACSFSYEVRQGE